MRPFIPNSSQSLFDIRQVNPICIFNPIKVSDSINEILTSTKLENSIVRTKRKYPFCSRLRKRS